MSPKNLRPDIAASTAAALLMPVAVVGSIAIAMVIIQEIYGPLIKNRHPHRHRFSDPNDSHWLLERDNNFSTKTNSVPLSAPALR